MYENDRSAFKSAFTRALEGKDYVVYEKDVASARKGDGEQDK
jgi:hypothetical protein